MLNRITPLLANILLLTGCTVLQEQAEEFGTSVLARTLSLCDGEMWISNEADEKLCVRRSLERPDTFLITQDALEHWGDELAKLVENSATVAAQHPPVFSIYANVIDDDTPAKWRKAARHYMRKHYGARATLARFERLGNSTAYIFEVQPGDQIPDWEQKQVPEYVLASQIPDAHLYYSPLRAYAGSFPRRESPRPQPQVKSRVQTGPGGTGLSLTDMLQTAVASSRKPGRPQRFVATERLDPGAYRHYAAAWRSPPPTLASCSDDGTGAC